VIVRAFCFQIDEGDTNFLSEISISKFSQDQDPKRALPVTHAVGKLEAANSV
jgi:hypothetical protein